MSRACRMFGLLLAIASLAAAATPHSKAELERIILQSRHLGAHGLGYNDLSLRELSHALTPEDIPNLISLLGDTKIRVGTEFALASQCEAAIESLRDALIQGDKVDALDAQDTMELIAGFSQCKPETHARARAARIEIDKINKDRQARKLQELQEKAKEDARIQQNGIKMLDPEQKKTLTRAEREEVFKRSVKAAGLENPQTPEQKALVERMYRAMVLAEPTAPKKQ
ncbi:MAG TPA: hypothetical protein VF532_23390 [Candidatus Angelobacter sp.]